MMNKTSRYQLTITAVSELLAFTWWLWHASTNLPVAAVGAALIVAAGMVLVLFPRDAAHSRPVAVSLPRLPLIVFVITAAVSMGGSEFILGGVFWALGWWRTDVALSAMVAGLLAAFPGWGMLMALFHDPLTGRRWLREGLARAKAVAQHHA